MLTTHQIKAARALLDWTQSQLAKAAGLHLNVINNIERGSSNPRQGTLEKIQTTLENHGIAFIGNRGVELKRDTVAMMKFEGDDFIKSLTADIVSAAPSKGEVLSILADISNFANQDNAAYTAEKNKRGFSERLITRDMPGFYPRHSSSYRVVPGENLGSIDTIIYADRVAYIFWAQKETIILKSAPLADTQKRLFESLWQAGYEPIRPSRAAND